MTLYRDLDDETLVTHTLMGETAAYSELYRRHVVAITSYVHRRCGSAHDAADIAAETFASALIDLHKFNAGRGTFKFWLYGIARNKWRRWARTGNVQQRARARLGISAAEPVEDDTNRICEIIDAESYNAELQRRLGELPAKIADVITLRVIEGHDYTHVADTLGITQATARKRLSRGLEKLATQIERPGN